MVVSTPRIRPDHRSGRKQKSTSTYSLLYSYGLWRASSRSCVPRQIALHDPTWDQLSHTSPWANISTSQLNNNIGLQADSIVTDLSVGDIGRAASPALPLSTWPAKIPPKSPLLGRLLAMSKGLLIVSGPGLTSAPFT